MDRIKRMIGFFIFGLIISFVVFLGVEAIEAGHGGLVLGVLLGLVMVHLWKSWKEFK